MGGAGIMFVLNTVSDDVVHGVGQCGLHTVLCRDPQEMSSPKKTTAGRN